MKPLKSLEPLSKWLLRAGVLLFVIIHYWDTFKQFEIHNIYNLLILLFFLFGVLLFIGGFRKNGSLTVISGLLIFAISAYFVIRGFNGVFDKDLLFFIFPASTGLFFLSKGNA